VPVTINGSGPIAGASTLNGLTIPTTGFGKVLQVIMGTTSTAKSATSSTFIDTGLTASITPVSTSSKVLILVSQAGCGKTTNDTTLGLSLLRGSTVLIYFELAGGWTNSTATNIFGTCSTVYLDSPATTSTTTYKTQMNSFNGGSSTHTQYNVGQGASTSTIVLVEVGP